jgi:hypothetical protein
MRFLFVDGSECWYISLTDDPCEQPAQLDPNVGPVDVDGSIANQPLILIENCTTWQTFDYFFGMDSHLSFPFTFIWLGLAVPGKMIVTLCIMLYRCRSSVHLSLVVEIIRLY